MARGEEPACQCRRCHRRGFNRWVRKLPWRRASQPTPVFLPGESHGRGSLAGCGAPSVSLEDRGLRWGSCPSPLSPPPPTPSLAVWPAQLSCPGTRRPMFVKPPSPALEELLALRAPIRVVRFPHDPEGLARSDFVLWTLCFSPSRLLYPPSASWLWPQRQPLSVPANTSQLCADKSLASQWGPGPQKGHFQGTLGAAAGRAEATV